jgi:hypothetical protein
MAVQISADEASWRAVPQHDVVYQDLVDRFGFDGAYNALT